MRLEVLAEDGLLVLTEDSLSATPEGLLLLRVVAMVFDEYLPQNQPTGRLIPR